MKNFLKKILIRILTIEARLILKKYKPKIVAITGSVGKTTTKEAIACVLSHFGDIRKSPKSYNSDFGVPLSIIGVSTGWSSFSKWVEIILQGFLLVVWKRPYPKCLVLEVGAGKPGDISRIAAWLSVDIAVITRFPDVPVHVEFFKSREHLIEEKAQLLKAIKGDGILILNHDDADVLELKKGVPRSVVTYGLSEQADISASNISLWYEEEGDTVPAGLQFKINMDGSSLPLFMRHAISPIHIYAALSALAVATKLGYNVLEAASSLAQWQGLPGRLSLVEGMSSSLIIDDTYNASPTAMEAALDVLSHFPGPGRKIAVLGDMLELGKFTRDAHIAIGKYCTDRCSILLTSGKRALHIKEGAIEAGFDEKNIFSFDFSDQAGDFLKNNIKPGDIILVKGSQGARMEKTVEKIMAHPENKERLLIRQEKEWLRR